MNIKIKIAIGIMLVSLVGLVVTMRLRKDISVLHVYAWSDYIDPTLIERFEEENGCRVVIDTFDDNETLLAKMMSGGGGYDILMPSSYIVPILVKEGIIKSLDPKRLPRVLENYDRRYDTLMHEYSLKYTVPYGFSLTGIAYRSDKIKLEGEEVSWDVLKRADLRKRTNILNDIREMLGIGLLVQGENPNETDAEKVRKAADYVIGLKRNARRVDNVEYRMGLSSGVIDIAIGYNSDVLQVQQENEGMGLAFIVPKEGTTCCWDELCITAETEEEELAHKFIDFLYEPKNAAQNIEYICTIHPNKGMWKYLSEEQKNNPMINISEEVLKKAHLIKDIGDKVEIFNTEWDRVTRE